MGKPQGGIEQRTEGDDKPSGYRANSGSFNFNRKNVEAGEATRFKRKYPLPSVGDRFEELTVVGFSDYVPNKITMVKVSCSCGAPPHLVYDYNLRKGSSTRCGKCARKKSGFWRKKYHGYADIVQDPEHRTRLLGRISACINRCGNPNDRGYVNYGARGIKVFEEWVSDRKEFLRYVITLPGWDEKNLELDRIDVNKGYEPGNLRFVSHKDNQNNKRTVQDLQKRIEFLEGCLRFIHGWSP